MTKELSIPGTENTWVQQELAVIAEHWSALQIVATAIEQEQVNSPQYLAHVSEIRSLNVEALKHMHKAVGMLAAESLGKIAAMMTMEWIIPAAFEALRGGHRGGRER